MSNFNDLGKLELALAQRDALAKTLKEAKAFMVIEELSPAEHSFEIEKRKVFRKQLFDRIDQVLGDQ